MRVLSAWLAGAAASAIKTNCLGWPAHDFTPSNHASVSPFIHEGEGLVDISLKDVTGKTVGITTDLLSTKNVVVMTCSYT